MHPHACIRSIQTFHHIMMPSWVALIFPHRTTTEKTTQHSTSQHTASVEVHHSKCYNSTVRERHAPRSKPWSKQCSFPPKTAVLTSPTPLSPTTHPAVPQHPPLAMQKTPQLITVRTLTAQLYSMEYQNLPTLPLAARLVEGRR